MPALPDLPAVAETVAGFEMAPWVGIVAPARTPKKIVERLAQETPAIMHDPQGVKQLTDQQVTPFALTPDRFGELIGKDLEKWAGVIKTAGIKGEGYRPPRAVGLLSQLGRWSPPRSRRAWSPAAGRASPCQRVARPVLRRTQCTTFTSVRSSCKSATQSALSSRRGSSRWRSS